MDFSTFINEVFLYWKNIIYQTYINYPIKTILCIFLIIIFTFLIKKISHRSYLFALFTFPATLMHELTHLTFSVLTFGKPSKINLIPRKTENGIIFGYVENNNISFYNAVFIGLAPLTLLFLGIAFIFKYLIPEQNLMLTLVYFYLSLMFIEGGVPSKTDLKVALISWPLLIPIGVIPLFSKL